MNDAATILIFRERPHQQLFMVRRHAKSAFMPNAMVFPGGRVDPSDMSLTWKTQVLEPLTVPRIVAQPDRAHYIAAARETYEEAGILFANRNGQPIDANTPMGRELFGPCRAALNRSDIGFQDILQRYDLILDLSRLSYFSRWITPEVEKRRFDARFFVAELPPTQSPEFDKLETSEGVWLAPKDALALYEQRKIQLAPPTLRILLTLDHDWSALKRPAKGCYAAIEPQALFAGDELHLLLPGDLDYRPPGTERNRIIRRDNHWISVGEGT
ncbi:MAG: hypothetical protein CMH52_05585 [Myxococcales bacterium]|nr:hypothetical protein [Myxococcales bacterium]|tara:strand:+ start:2204 stop:3016 length:813 start_codon:yes stop_codon:yes gene_type:complete